MSLRSRMTAVAVIVITVMIAMVFAGTELPDWEQRQQEQLEEAARGKETVLIWYTDEVLTDFISSAAVAFNEEPENQGVRVLPVLVSGLEYLESINAASIENNTPDLYVVGHDSLEKAYLAGLATEIKPPSRLDVTKIYPETGLNAVTYDGKVIGYPFYFETSALLYNKTYLQDMARLQLEMEADQAAGLEAQQELEENGPQEESAADDTANRSNEGEGNDTEGNGTDGNDTEGNDTDGNDTDRDEGDGAVSNEGDDGGMDHADGSEGGENSDQSLHDMMVIENRVATLLPQTLADMKSFGETYDAPEQVESIFKWDVTDIFYNYFFVGHSMVVGGESGDDVSRIDIYNADAISSMKMYQNLNQFFAIDTGEVDYQDILEDFIAGKLVFTVVTTDAVARLEQAAEDGEFPYEYGILRTPDIDEDTPTRSLSMTSCVVVNGYSDHQEEANRFARYLTEEWADELYAKTGKAAAVTGIVYDNANLDRFAEEYARSIPLPKMIETSNFWVQLEIAFARIWDGANANQELKQLSEQIMTQVTGEPYVEEEIEEAEEETEVEYLDEDALTQEALDS